MRNQFEAVALWMVVIGGSIVSVTTGCNQSPVSLGAADMAMGPEPCTSAAITKGPYVIRATATSASIFWESRDSQGCVEAALAPEDGGGPERIITGKATATQVVSEYGVGQIPYPDYSGTWYLSEVALEGLSPGTCYRYRVRRGSDGGVGDVEGRFCTARPSGTPFTFLAIGDTDPALGHTVPIFKYVLPSKPDFIVHTGDIQYYTAFVESWAYWFKLMEPMMAGAGSFFPAVGNHESELNGLEFNDYFDRLFHQASKDGTPRYFRFEWGGVWFVTVDTESPYDSGSPQYAWLHQTLDEVMSKPGYRFTVVYMHRNLYTLGDTALVDQRMVLGPLFDNKKVRLVLSGHMHGYERFEVGDVTYVTTAGGGGTIGDVSESAARYPMDVPLRVVGKPSYHAMLFDVTPMGMATTVHARAIDEFGVTIDEFTHLIP